MSPNRLRDEELLTVLQRRADAAVPVMTLDPAAVLEGGRAHSRRSTRRRVAGTAAGLAGLTGLAGVTMGVLSMAGPDSSMIGPAHTTTAPNATPAPLLTAETTLEVSCSPDGVAVSADTVQASPDGVRFRVSSTAPPGTYLFFGGFGEALPPTEETWTFDHLPPGEMTVFCQHDGVLAAEQAFAITDPNGYWSTTTLADLGCHGGADAQFVIGPGSGPTAQAAVEDLAAAFWADRSDGTRLDQPEVVRAPVGYTGSPEGVWFFSAPDLGRLTAQVRPDGTGFTAVPDRICG